MGREGRSAAPVVTASWACSARVAGLSWPLTLMPVLDLITYSLPAALQLLLAVVMLRRSGYRRYPFFFVYTVASVIITAVQLPLAAWPVPYFIAHCAGEVLYSLLGLLAIAEVFEVGLGLAYERHVWLRYALLPGVLLVLAAIGAWRAAYHPFGSSLLAHLTPGAWSFVIGARALETGLYVGGWALRRGGRMAMAERPFKILTGFGLAAFFSLIAYLLRYPLGPKLEPVFRYFPVGAYLASTWLWLRTFLRAEPDDDLPRPQLAKVQGLLDFMNEERKILERLGLVDGMDLVDEVD